ncbi:polyprenyl synthetase family protein [Streptomyces sp. NPDC007205]|uniref:polyprenyl synthetase family protein n=1 Tax=Streptomyces sp. NPDC007205 TaxID=3154316 RepID=UPI0033D0E4AE
MTLAPVVTDQLDLPGARDRVEAILKDFLHTKALDARMKQLPPLAASVLTDYFTAGGKRLRPMLCVLGWHAAGGITPAPDTVLRVAAALEMFHAFALIHDDVMDASDTRRGQPTIHRTLAHRYGQGRTHQRANRLGEAAAILVGDLALCWSNELLNTAGLASDQLARVLPVLDAMRTEVIYGQYLDVTATGTPSSDLDQALLIIRYKTAKYTIERPLHLGALLAGADNSLLKTLSAYALPLGEAFQLRDDLLGVFGNPALTGKSRLNDLREGKHTALIALAMRDATPHHKNLLHRMLGQPDLTGAEAAQIRNILTVTGARTHVEDLITQRRTTVMRLLDTTPALAPQAIPHLRHLADTTTRRTT